MKNKFYTDFDFERLKDSPRLDEYRTPFQIDRDRIIHSSEFRRMQGKTQVFIPGEFDFYRTRLTHSIEVSQIGRSICNFLLFKEKNILNDSYFIDPDLVESSCLSHDLGHPPFGHAGERTLNKLMEDFGGFEGNAQTLRQLTEIFYTDEKKRRGMNPTRAFIDSILKYKALRKQFEKPKNHFIYDSQKYVLDFVFDGRALNFDSPEELNKFRSIECQILDWSDDTAYALHDIVDSIYAGFMTISRIYRWIEEHESEITRNQKKYLEEITEWIKAGDFKRKFGSQIGNCVQATSLRERETFIDDLTNRYKYELVIDEDCFEKAEIYKRISVDLVFQSAQLHQMEFKGNSMLTKIFEALKLNYVDELRGIKLLPDFSDYIIRREEDPAKRARLVCDYIAGMTDAFALRTYKRLFDPEFGSIVDLV